MESHPQKLGGILICDPSWVEIIGSFATQSSRFDFPSCLGTYDSLKDYLEGCIKNSNDLSKMVIVISGSFALEKIIELRAYQNIIKAVAIFIKNNNGNFSQIEMNDPFFIGVYNNVNDLISSLIKKYENNNNTTMTMTTTTISQNDNVPADSFLGKSMEEVWNFYKEAFPLQQHSIVSFNSRVVVEFFQNFLRSSREKEFQSRMVLLKFLYYYIQEKENDKK